MVQDLWMASSSLPVSRGEGQCRALHLSVYADLSRRAMSASPVNGIDIFSQRGARARLRDKLTWDSKILPQVLKRTAIRLRSSSPSSSFPSSLDGCFHNLKGKISKASRQSSSPLPFLFPRNVSRRLGDGAVADSRPRRNLTDKTAEEHGALVNRSRCPQTQ